MTMFSWLEFKQKWAEMSVEEQKTFFIWLGITILVMFCIGVFDYIKRRKSKIK